MSARSGYFSSFAAILVIALVAALLSYLAGFPEMAVLAISVFFAEIAATLLLWDRRVPVAFLGVALLLALGALNIESFLRFANLDVIFFLIGMMAFVGTLEERHFFDRLVSITLNASKGNGVVLILAVLALSALLAALVDEVTSIVVMTSFILPLSRFAGVSPVPLLLLSIFATNIGSSATVIGNPVGVLVAFRGGLTFGDFLRWATPISVLALAVLTVLAFRFQRSYIVSFTMGLASQQRVVPQDESTGSKSFKRDAILFLSTITGLALHHQLEELLHLEKNTLLLGIPLMAAAVSIMIDLDRGMKAFRERVDWPTLIFFAMLFASVGALESSGFIEYFSQGFSSVTGGTFELTLLLYSTTATLMSAFMDNVLAVAVLLPVVEALAVAGISSFPLYWVSLFCGTIGGNLTPIGSTANIVALGLLEKAGYQRPSLREWLRHGWWATVVPLALAVSLIYVQTPLMP
ncbi:SLC13 family permease [Infirmifilum sp. NZ]|uniref:SLC13 family permease n=1 Tax=Infirmifilum sp. NZ TaxID=2926850 RepID=UPI00279B04C4|nr:SLC13 family permease [Infirmifilum sp. NZ]UNQ73588.1 anion permease [Infirmifilum sp. NZ]